MLNFGIRKKVEILLKPNLLYLDDWAFFLKSRKKVGVVLFIKIINLLLIKNKYYEKFSLFNVFNYFNFL
jgi:hypothetical protein